MLFQASDVSNGWRISLRFVILLAIPAGLILWLLYSAQAGEEATHARNLRWLAQMATQITNRVQNHSDFIRDRDPQTNSATKIAVSQPAPSAYTIENLQPAECVAKDQKNLTVVEEGAERWLYFQHAGRGECARSDLKALVESAIRKGAFTSVILADRKGKVLYQSGPESLRITDIGFLFSRSAADRSKLSGAPAAKDAPPRSDAPTSSVHLTSVIGDEQFQIFVQPLLLRVDSATKDNDWLLIGIAEKHYMLGSSTPNGLMLIAPLVLLLLGMIWPLQRLWSMSPAEALRRRHVVVVGLCSLGVVIVLSLLVVFEYSRRLSMARADDQLRNFASALGRNCVTELGRAVAQLRRLDEMVSKSNAATRSKILSGLLKDSDVYLPFEYANWIDGKGDRILGWTTKAAMPQPVNVADRTYFKDVMAKTTLVLPRISNQNAVPAAEKIGQGVAVQQVLSRTSGETVTMLGIPSRMQGRNGIQVASLAVNLLSLSDPVVMRDLGFAIIDGTGSVLFHSERSRIFVENLFEESQDSDELKGIVARRIPAFLDLDYDATPHRMFVSPLPGVERLPWTLVVFRKLAPTRINRMQILVDTAAMLGVYGIGVGLSVVLFMALPGRKVRGCSSLIKWGAALHRGRLYAAGGGLVLACIVWRAFEQIHGPDLLGVAIAGALAFLTITSLALRYRVGINRLGSLSQPAGMRGSVAGLRRLFRAACVPALLAIFALCLGDTFMAWAAPAAVFLWGLLLPRIFEMLPRRDRPTLHRKVWLAWGVELALLLCIAPALLLTRMSFEYEVGLRTRDSQLWLTRAADLKDKEVMRAIDQTPGVGESKEMRNKLLSARFQDGGKNPTKLLYYYAGDTSRLLMSQAGNRTEQCQPNASPSAGPRIGLAAEVSGRILSNIELPNDERFLGAEARRRALRPADSLWTWDEHDRSITLCSEDRFVLGTARLPVFDPFQIPLVQAQSEEGKLAPAPVSLVSAAPAWVELIGLLAAMALWMNVLRRRLMLENVSSLASGREASYDPDAPAPQRLFLIAHPGGPAKPLPQSLTSYRRIDLALEDFRLDLKAMQSPVPEGLLFDRFETRLQDPQVRAGRLELLEAALLVQGTPIAIRSSIDCLAYLSGGGSGDEASAPDEVELKRWRALMNHFDRRVLPVGQETVIDCAAIWDSCSEHEKDVLMQLCRHGLANPCAGGIVSRLLGRGLLRRTRVLGLEFSRPEFRRFVGDATSLVREKRHRRAGSSRLPAYAIGLLLVGFAVLFSQEELTTRLVGFLTTVAGGFEAVRKQLAEIQDFSGTKKS